MNSIEENKQQSPNVYHADSIWELNFAHFVSFNQKRNTNILCTTFKDLKMSTPNFLKMLDSIDKKKFLLQSNKDFMVTDNADDFLIYGYFNSVIDEISEVTFLYVEHLKSSLENSFKFFEKEDKKDYLDIRWYSISGGNLNYINIVSDAPETIKPSLYPFIDYEKVFTNFEKSSSNILVLIGEPGTGKSTFIRNLIKNSNFKCPEVFLTYDGRVLEEDAFFIEFLSHNKPAFMVIEDADSYIGPKEDGNGIVAKFLNSGDGLIRPKEKKIIISTNILNVNHIDSALTRPGRCFDIINFRSLTGTEANAIAEDYSLNKSFILNERYTLAQVFNGNIDNKKTFGFV